jgi:hypothetical protein
MENNKKIAEYSLNQMKELTDRYIEAEQFIMELNWFERLFCSNKIRKFLKSRTEKYNF